MMSSHWCVPPSRSRKTLALWLPSSRSSGPLSGAALLLEICSLLQPAQFFVRKRSSEKSEVLVTMSLSGGLIVSQAAIKTGFGPWVKYKGPAKGTRRHAHYAIISQTSSAIRCLGTNTHARAQLESVRAGLGWLSSCPCPVCLVWSGAPLVTELRTRLPPG